MIIAIVDDDPLQHYILKNMGASLEPSVKFISFFNGKEILDYLEQDNLLLYPDVILLDLKMPFKDGWGFLEEFKSFKTAVKDNIKVYICTSSIDPEDASRAIGVAPLLRKPVSYEDLIRIITEGDK